MKIEELQKIYELQNGNEFYADELIQSYEYLVRQIIKEFPTYLNKEELYTEGVTYMYIGLKKYKPGDIEGFLATCIRNGLKMYMRSEVRQYKRERKLIKNIKDDKLLGKNYKKSQGVRAPIELYEDNSADKEVLFNETMEEIREALDNEQFDILMLLYDGYTHDQISDKYNVTRQAMSKRIKVIKDIVKPLLAP